MGEGGSLFDVEGWGRGAKLITVLHRGMCLSLNPTSDSEIYGQPEIPLDVYKDKICLYDTARS